jgi:arginine/lysine/ornithine decarboxylase
MGVASKNPKRPVLFAVQSTHKMLPALSMASMIHVVREVGRGSKVLNQPRKRPASPSRAHTMKRVRR